MGGLAVAAGATGFLVIAFDVFGHVEVADKAHIGFVDAHAKGNGGHHDDAFFAQKTVLVTLAGLGRQAGMVGQGIEAMRGQLRGHVFNLAARLAVHHARVVQPFTVDLGAVLLPNKADELLDAVFFFDDGVADVGAVEAADEEARVLQLQLGHDVVAGDGVGGGREGDAGHIVKTLVQHSQAQVVGPKVVPPLADAVGFVNGKEAERGALVQGVQQAHEARGGESLGRHIEQRELAAQGLLLDLGGLLRREAGVEVGCGHTGLAQRAHLVVHEGDKRRDHNGHAQALAVTHDGGHLVAQRFAAARGHEHQRTLPSSNMGGDIGLLAPECGVAKHLLQHLQTSAGGGDLGHYICSQGSPSNRQPLSVERWNWSLSSPSKPCTTWLTSTKPACSRASPASMVRLPLRQSNSTGRVVSPPASCSTCSAKRWGLGVRSG